MAIRGWSGPTRVVDDVGECPVVPGQYWMPFSSVWAGLGDIYIARIGDFGIETAFGTVLSPHGADRAHATRIHPDSLAALRALADAHNGSWRATPVPPPDADATGA